MPRVGPSPSKLVRPDYPVTGYPVQPVQISRTGKSCYIRGNSILVLRWKLDRPEKDYPVTGYPVQLHVIQPVQISRTEKSYYIPGNFILVIRWKLVRLEQDYPVVGYPV